MKEKINKYLYGWNIWTNWDGNWEIECFYDRKESKFKEVFADAKGYREAGARTRITKTRVKNPDYK